MKMKHALGLALLLITAILPALAESTPCPTPTRPPLMPTPPPVMDISDVPENLVLYYNPDGGLRYHLSANCGTVHEMYLPLQGEFLYCEVNDEPYCHLKSCALCCAPPRPSAPEVPPTTTPAPLQVWMNGLPVENFVREEPISMPGAGAYLPRDYAVSTWRGNNFRQNAAVGTLAHAPASLEEVWSADFTPAGHMLYCFDEAIQPAIIQWPREIRAGMDMTDSAKNTAALKEVILPSMDGRIHFLNLTDGSITREALDLGYPLTGSVTLHPLSYPLLLVGQSYSFLPGGSGHIGMYYLEAITGHIVRFLDGNAAFPDMLRQSRYGAFTTSALVDRNTNTAVFLSRDGWLFTEKLDLRLILDDKQDLIYLSFDRPQSVAAKVTDYEVTAAPVMHGSLLWLGNAYGQVICIDTSTMQPVWTMDFRSRVSALAMRETSTGLQLWVCAGQGASRLLCLNPDTGDVIRDIDMRNPGAPEEPSVISPPLVGQSSLEGLILVCLTESSGGGLSGLIAIDADSGECRWTTPLTGGAATAPVAVYSEDGSGYVIAVTEHDESTALTLLDALTGEALHTLTLAGCSPCSPAVFGNMLVITTSTEDGSTVHGVRILDEPERMQPDPVSANDLAPLTSFMNAWAAFDRETMLSLCAPSWKAAQSDPELRLFLLLANRVPTAFAIPVDSTDPFTVCARVAGRWYMFRIPLVEEDGQYWIVPEGLAVPEAVGEPPDVGLTYPAPAEK